MEDADRAAAYVAWRTFTNALDRLREAGLPNRVDRSVFVGMAGGTQNQLVAALKFLGLVDGDGVPSPQLTELTRLDELKRKPPLRRVFEAAYSKLIELDLAKASPDQLEEAMGESYNVRGSTRQKAVRFFLLGAEELGIEISDFLKQAGKKKLPVGNGSSRRRRRRAATETPAPASQSAGTSKTVKLTSGGELHLSATFNLFELSAEDRQFLYDLSKMLDDYVAQSSREETKASMQPDSLGG